MAYSKIAQATFGAALLMSLPATAQEPTAAGGVPADWVGCDSTCRARRANPKPDIVSPEVSKAGEVTVRVYAPKASSMGVGGL